MKNAICKQEIEREIHKLQYKLRQYEKLFLNQSEQIRELINKLVRDGYMVYISDLNLLIRGEVACEYDYDGEKKSKTLSLMFSIEMLDSLSISPYEMITDRILELRQGK